MGTYAVTGGASGIGASVCKALQKHGHDTISIDIRNADINADLSTEAGCQDAIKQLHAKASSGLDGFVPCAGVGTNIPGDTLVAINYVGVVRTTEGAMDLLQKKNGTVVVISSNSITMKYDNSALCEALLDEQYEQAYAIAKKEKNGASNYAGTKKALVFWMRRNCAEWVKKGVRVNAVAPGMTMTPLVQSQFDDPNFADLMEEFRSKIPMGSAKPDDIAKTILFLLGDDSSYCCGSLLFVDGGIEALSRPNEL